MSVVALWLLWTITVSARYSRQPAYSQAIDNGTYGIYPVRTYATEESLSSPRINWLKWSPDCDDGRYIFITPRGASLPRPGPMILDSSGELVWSEWYGMFGAQAYDLQVQQYQGQDYLTFWLGDDAVRGHGAGVYYMMNSSYDVVHEVRAAAGRQGDLHEFLITPQGTALITVYEKLQRNITAFHTPGLNSTAETENGWIWDCLLQEISIETGDLLFEWRASDHVELAEGYRYDDNEGSFEAPWDWYHINSISKDELGNYLISARFVHSITYIDGRTGQILWSLGGKRNDFVDLSGNETLKFAWQHDARFHAPDAFSEIYTPSVEAGVTRRLLTLFDNAEDIAVSDYGQEKSRGLLLELTYPEGAVASRKTIQTNDSIEQLGEKNLSSINGTDSRYTVRIIKSYENPRALRTMSQGSMQILEGRETNVLVGYGYNAVWTEYDLNGTVLCDVHYGSETSWGSGSIQSYRAYKYDWIGRPKWKPKIEISDDELEVYMSWNGATEVAEWILQGSDLEQIDDGAHWSDIARIPKDGFETWIELPHNHVTSRRYLRALALDKHGHLLEHGISQLLDRDEISLHVELVHQLSLTSHTSGFVVMIIVVFAAILTYDLFRKWRSWSIGRPGAGRIRWKQGILYRRISGEA